MSNLTVLEVNGQFVVDSRLVADELGIAHRGLRQTIEKYLTELQVFGAIAFEMHEFKTAQGNISRERYCYLNEDQATFLMTLSRNTSQVVVCKQHLVQAFSKAKKLLKQEFVSQTSKLVSDETVAIHLQAIKQFEGSGDLQLAQLFKSRIGNFILAEQQNLLKPVEVEQYEGAIDVAIRLGFSVPSNYESSLGKFVKKQCEHLLIGQNNRYSTASHKQIPANMYPAFNREVQQAVIDYCVTKSFRRKDINLLY